MSVLGTADSSVDEMFDGKYFFLFQVVLYEPNMTSKLNESSSSSTAKSTPVTSTTLWRLENHQEEKWLFAQVYCIRRDSFLSSFPFPFRVQITCVI